jgi:NAD(P)-dependent dehydrogenase (short-subunit alcohol dehydrogenase family)
VSGVVLADVDEKGAQEAAEKSREFARHSGYSTLVVHVDVTDAASVEAMVDAAVQRFGRIDYNINCAGVSA